VQFWKQTFEDWDGTLETVMSELTWQQDNYRPAACLRNPGQLYFLVLTHLPRSV
jgi:hypothetical protein